MAEYTYADIIMDPNDPRLEGAIGKECYFNDSPKMILEHANNNSPNNFFSLKEINENNEYPFTDGKYEDVWTLIIIKKEEPKLEYLPFYDAREFIDAYRNAPGCLNEEDYFLSNHGIWLKAKDADDALFMVTEIWNYGVVVSGNMKTTEESEDFYLTINEATTWEQLLKRYTFLDGSPCGKEVKDE